MRKYISQLSLGNRTVHRNLTMFGLGGILEGGLQYLTLEDAIAMDVARVSEISDAGRVPELLFENSADLPVLILDGEELVGAKQNRTVNLTILAPARKTITIPVSCVEAGRWRRESTLFVISDRHHFARGRARKAEAVSCSLQRDGSRHSDQRRVWADIDGKAARMGAPSATRAMAEIFDRHRSSLEGYVGAFTASESQTGALFAIGSEIVGLDLFDRHSTLTAVLPKLVRSYAIDAMEAERGHGQGATQSYAEAFLEQLAEAEIETYEAVGLGSDLRFTSRTLIGGALAVDSRLVHLAAFAIAADSTAPRSNPGNMAGMRSRRRSYGSR
jgi:hypothetical protein